MPFDFIWLRIIAGLVTPIIFFFAIRKYYPQVFPKVWFILRARWIKLPFRKSPMVKKTLKKEEEDSKKQRYETFEAFLKDCPKYQIASGVLDVMIRNIYRNAGATFQQYVFIDEASIVDKTAWIRVVGDMFIHDRGTYFRPWKSEKDIIYYKYKDSRPLIDKASDAPWQNPNAFAEVVTAVTNANNIAGFRGQEGQNQNMYLLGACILIIVLIAVDIYTGDASNKTLTALLNKIVEQTKP